TGPVTSSASACRGEATSRAPYRSPSYTGPNTEAISTSQPLHDPASTCRICTDPASSAASAGASPLGRSGAGSATRPVFLIFRHRLTRRLLLPTQLISLGPG